MIRDPGMNPTTMQTESLPQSELHTYQIGTLVYTRRGLVALLFWLLWGDFAFTFFESIFSRFFPIYLKDLQASNTLIGMMTGSFAGLVNVVFLPGISRWSDNFRSRLGRRIPFLYVSTPLVVCSLILTGFAPEIGGGVFDRFAAHLPGSITRGGLILGLLSALTVSFHFFNMVLVGSYNCLIRDVVPQSLISRFLAWFRIVGTVSSVFFLWYVFPHILTYRREICLGIGLFYLAAFFLMCSRVKEGEYPPPESAERHLGILNTYRAYCRECLQIPLYCWFFLTYLLVSMAINCANGFTTLFVKDTLGIEMTSLGQIFSWIAGLSAIIFFALGWLCDRLSPLWVTLASIIGLCLCPILGYVAVNSGRGYLVYCLIFSLPTSAWALGSMAAAMKLFPGEEFGQFFAGMNIFGCGGLIIGNLLIGALMDLVHNDYRMAFLWTTVVSGLAIFPMLRVIREWKRYGGPNRYVPPLPVGKA